MTTFSREFLALTRNMTGKDLGERVIGSGGMKYMGIGTHAVRVSGVDRNGLGQNKLTIKYENDKGQEHSDFLFLVEKNKKTGLTEINYRLAGTLGMLVPSEEAYDALMAEVQAGNVAVFDLLIGLRGEITLARGRGFGPAEAQADGTYQVRNVQKPEDFYVGNTIEEAQAAATQAGLKKAYINVVSYKATDAAENIEKFAAGLSAAHKPNTKSQPVSTSFSFGRMAV